VGDFGLREFGQLPDLWVLDCHEAYYMRPRRIYVSLPLWTGFRVQYTGSVDFKETSPLPQVVSFAAQGNPIHLFTTIGGVDGSHCMRMEGSV